MAAVLFRRGTGLCCIHRELCRVVWRSQTALYSFKPSQGYQPRRTHIKKAKHQPAVDVSKLLEQIFSHRRPGSKPPAAKVPPPTPSTTTSNIPHLSKEEPEVFPASSTIKEVADDISKMKVPATSTTSAALASNTSKESQTVTEAEETKVETAKVLPSSEHTQEKNMETSSSPAPTLETLIEHALESPVEPEISPVETLEVRAAVVEGPVDTPAEGVTDSGLSYNTKKELLIEITESPVEITYSPVERIETGAAVTAMEAEADTTIQTLETNTTDLGFGHLSHTAEEQPLIGTTESPVEASHVAFETLETIPAVVEGSVEPTLDITVNVAAPKIEIQSTDSGPVTLLHTDKEEALIETIEPSVDTSHFALETLESEAAVVEDPIQSSIDVTVNAEKEGNKSTDSGVSYSTKEEPLTGTIEPVEAIHLPLERIETRDTAADGSVETPVESDADTTDKVETQSPDVGPVNLLHTAEEKALIETIEQPVETSLFALETLETKATKFENPEETTADVTVQVEALKVETQSTYEMNLLQTPKEEPAIESTIDTSTCHVSGGTIEPTMETEEAENLSHAALILNAQDSALLSLNNESNVESSSVNVDQDLVVSLEKEELILTKSVLEEQLKDIGDKRKAAENSRVDEQQILPGVPSKCDSLSEDLQELEGNSGLLVKELLCPVPAELSKTPEANGEDESMSLESITLAKVMGAFGSLEAEALLETRNALEEEAEVLAKVEKMRVETTEEEALVSEDTSEVDILTLDSISEATDAIEAETSVMLEAILGVKQGQRHQEVGQNESTGQEAEKESGEEQGSGIEAMAEVEASLETLENESLNETTEYLDREGDPGEDRVEVEVEDMMASKEPTEDLKIESEDLEELLTSDPSHATHGPVGQEVIRADIVQAAEVMEDLKEELLEERMEEDEEEEAQTGALREEDAIGTHADLDPVQRLFLEKIREYNNMHRLNGGQLEEEPDYIKHLSEERAKLQRLYGGGDLSSFPQFSFSEPEMDKDSK